MSYKSLKILPQVQCPIGRVYEVACGLEHTEIFNSSMDYVYSFRTFIFIVTISTPPILLFEFPQYIRNTQCLSNFHPIITLEKYL